MELRKQDDKPDRILVALEEIKNDRNKNAKFRQLTSEVLLLSLKKKAMMPFMCNIIPMLPNNDLLIKRFCTIFINRFIRDIPDLCYLMTNTLQKDCMDPNPLVRSLALRTCCCIPTLTDYSECLISQGLQDSSACVRRTAVLCCGRVFKVSPSMVFDKGFIDDLYSMLRDFDPIVVSNCLVTLEEILQDEGGVVINKNIAQYLLGWLSNFTEWNLVHVLNFLCKYVPKDDEEVQNIVEMLQPYFTHTNIAVCIAAAQYYLHLTDNHDVTTEPLVKIQSHFASFLKVVDDETAFVLLDFIDSVTVQLTNAFSSCFESFFCRYSDPSYLKLKKIRLLAKLISDENVSSILKELESYCLDLSVLVSTAAVETMQAVAVGNQQYLNQCLDSLLRLLEYESICSRVLGVLQMLEVPTAVHPSLLEILTKCKHDAMNSEGRSALLWLLGKHCQNLDKSVSLLETMVKYWEDEILNISFKQNLLLAAVKLFLHRPAESQYVLGQILELCSKDDDLTLRDRVNFYYTLLRMDVNTATRIVLYDRKV